MEAFVNIFYDKKKKKNTFNLSLVPAGTSLVEVS